MSKAKEHFGSRILRLAGERGLSLMDISRGAEIPYRTLNYWIRLATPPRARDRVRRLEAFLGGSVTAPVGVVGPAARVRARTNLARHYIREIIALIDSDAIELADIKDMLERADKELEEAQKQLAE
jgi:hypothetical protein